MGSTLGWDPSDPSKNPSLADGAAFSTLLAGDPEAFVGLCDPASAAAAGFASVSNLTRGAPTPQHEDGAIFTPTLVGVTAQASGCVCASVASTPATGTVAAASPDGSCVSGAVTDDGDATKVFYSPLSGKKSGWTVRQTTCPPGSDACTGGSSPPRFAGGCGLRTEARLPVARARFSPVAGADGVSAASIFTVEVAPGGDEGSELVSRVVEHRFELLSGGPSSIIVPVDVPETSSVVSRLVSASASRESDTTATALFTFKAYVRQSSASTPSSLDAGTAASAAVRTTGVSQGLAATCSPVGEGGVSCLAPGCAPSQLPGRFGASEAQWIGYSVVATCSFQTVGSADPSAPLVVGAASFSLSLPTIDAPSPALLRWSGSVSAPPVVPPSEPQIDSRFVILPAEGDATLSDLVYSTEQASTFGRTELNYGDAIALKIQLQSLSDRDALSVVPELLVVTSSPTTHGGASSPPRHLAPGETLGLDFCGVSGEGAEVSAYSRIDSSDGLMGAFDRAFAALSPELSAALASAPGPQERVTSWADVLPGVPRESGPTAFYVTDNTGGAAVPLKNRLGGDSPRVISVCAVVFVAPYAAVERGNFFPLFSTLAAAERASALVPDETSVRQPLVFFDGSFVAPEASGGSAPAAHVKYYMPYYPASTAGVLCVPEGSADTVQWMPSGSNDPAPDASRVRSITSPECVAALGQQPSGSRRMRRMVLQTTASLYASGERTVVFLPGSAPSAVERTISDAFAVAPGPAASVSAPQPAVAPSPAVVVSAPQPAMAPHELWTANGPPPPPAVTAAAPQPAVAPAGASVINTVVSGGEGGGLNLQELRNLPGDEGGGADSQELRNALESTPPPSVFKSAPVAVWVITAAVAVALVASAVTFRKQSRGYTKVPSSGKYTRDTSETMSRASGSKTGNGVASFRGGGLGV